MNLKKISKNSLLSNPEEKITKIKELLRKYRLIVCIILGILCFGIFIAFYNKSNRMQRLQDEYSVMISNYNSVIGEYNVELDRYNSLRDYLLTVFDEDIAINYDRKNEIVEDFESYYSEGADSNSIEQEIRQCASDKDEINSSYKKMCISKYNDYVGNYNEKASKYNSLLDKLKLYDISDIPDSVTLLKTVKLDDNDILEKWDDVKSYMNDIDDITDLNKEIGQDYYDACLETYNAAVVDYNIVATEYNNMIKETSVDFIDGMPDSIQLKNELEIETMKEMNEDEFCDSLESIFSDTENIAGDYLVVLQITNPEQQWVIDRLKNVESIKKVEAVTKSKDPNGLLGKNGGYTGCIYFSVKDIDASKIKGKSIIDKGTDVGGAIEIYENLEYALNRCDYLSQFDGTVLYSGSYAIIGTMVVRTSYKLTNSQQIKLTNDITNALTAIY